MLPNRRPISDGRRDLIKEGSRSFTDEAERLAKFNNAEGIVGILDCFSENDTAYMVMEMLDGKTVKQILEERDPLSYVDTLPKRRLLLRTCRDARLLQRIVHNAGCKNLR